MISVLLLGPDGVTSTAIISPATEEILVPEAMLSVLALIESGMTPKSGWEVLVTGASGGLGSFSEFLATFRQPLESERWAGAIDSVGGDVLSALLRAMAYRSGVACCGLARASDFSATVFPFILRGVRLIAIDSVYCPLEERQRAWEEIGKNAAPQGIGRNY